MCELVKWVSQRLCNWRKIGGGGTMLMVQLIVVVLLFSVLPHSTPIPWIDPRLEAMAMAGAGAGAGAREAATPNANANIFITMRKGTREVLNKNSAAGHTRAGSFKTLTEKRTSLYLNLRAHADETQTSVRRLLQDAYNGTLPMEITSFWITNQIYVRNTPIGRVLELLRERDDVASIEKEDYVHINSWGSGGHDHESQSVSGPKVSRAEGNVGYNMQVMRVPELWARGVDGTGVVVGSIDTGVLYTHEAFRDNYKNDNNSWLDALTDSRFQVPTDDHGTGTLFLGPAVGGGGIGVAPGAKWISCKAFDNNGTGSEASVLSCGQFILAPTRPDGSQPDPSKAPDVVTIGFGLPSKHVYDNIITLWREAGIIPVFAGLGSLGCSSLLFPAWLDVISVGATDQHGKLGLFSARGPGPNARVKPDVVAPGVGVLSASNAGHDAYAQIPDEKTPSAAGAEVAGVVALLLGVDPTLEYKELKQVLQATARQDLGGNGGGEAVCGGVPHSMFPNHHFGYGQVDALAAYECVMDGLSCLPDRNKGITPWQFGFVAGGAILFAITVTGVLMWWSKVRRSGRKTEVDAQPATATLEEEPARLGVGEMQRRPGAVEDLGNVVYRFHNGVLSLSWCQVDMELDDRTGADASAAPLAAGSGNYAAVTTPYDRTQFELLRSAIDIDEGNVLGCGQFGIVYAGRMRTRTEPPSTMAVAAKMVKRSQLRNANASMCLLKELQILIQVGTKKHANIVQLLGACTLSDDGGAPDIFVVLELCVNGNLEKYLRACRKILGRSASESEGDKDNTAATSFNSMADRLLQWTLQIASGMAFLVEKRVVHGDLAARNVLLDANLTARISDFGLAARLCEYAKYVRAEQMLLPWRWMALESLRDMRFSHASDVWSFGITAWEIFSLGQVPYQAMAVSGWTANFVQKLETGLRNEKPAYASEEMYAILNRCWNLDPACRPKMAEIKEMLSHSDD